MRCGVLPVNAQVDWALVKHAHLGRLPHWVEDAYGELAICDAMFAGADQRTWGAVLLAEVGVDAEPASSVQDTINHLKSLGVIHESPRAGLYAVIAPTADDGFEVFCNDRNHALVRAWWLKTPAGPVTSQANEANQVSQQASAAENPEAVQAIQSNILEIEPSRDATLSLAERSRNVNNTIRVDSDRLDKLLNTAGEMVITKARLNQQIDDLQRLVAEGYTSHAQVDMHEVWSVLTNAASSLNDTAQELHRHTSALQNSVMRTRMVPIGPLFNRFRRLIRDVCRATGKEAELIVSGEHTELDKRLIDELSDPLTHLIRNSIDHGLESVADRLQAGKPAAGQVKLRAVHRGGTVYIEVEDDGGGLNAKKIAAKALDRGLTTEVELQAMSEQEIFHFIFAPGFSTADQVSDISGRGVGMDIVRRSIEDLKGTIDVTSQAGVGTTFRLILPLTLSMIDALLVVIGTTRCAIPVDAVEEIIDIPLDEIHRPDGRDACF